MSETSHSRITEITPEELEMMPVAGAGIFDDIHKEINKMICRVRAKYYPYLPQCA